MSKRYILTLMAANRVGILAAVTTSLAELGGNLYEVSQTVLQKYFTIILAADFPDDRDPDVIVEHIRGACKTYGMEVSIKTPSIEEFPAEPEGGVDKYFLTVTGTDEPGIIRQISSRLAQENIDVTDLYAGRNDRQPQFMMVMELAVPLGVDALALQRDLERLGETIGLSATLQHADIFSATNDPRPVRVSPVPLPRRRLTRRKKSSQSK